MLEMTRHDWGQFERRLRLENGRWLRSLSLEDKLTIFVDLYRLAAVFDAAAPGREQLEERRWREKIALRRKIVAALQSLDPHDERRPAGTNTD